MSKAIGTLIVLVLLVTATFGLRLHHHKSKLTIGMLLCLSGECADWGAAALKGAQLAALELNQKGGVRGKTVRFVTEDTNESISGARAVSGFQKLRSADRLQIIIGPSWAPGALAVLPLAEKAKDLLLITPSASVQHFASSGDHLFNMRAAEETHAQMLAGYAIRKGLKRAAILSSQQPAEMRIGEAFEDAYKKYHGTITAHLIPLPESSAIRGAVTRVISTQPDIIFIACYTQLAAAARQLDLLEFKGPKLSYAVDQGRIDAAQGALEGAVIARFPGSTKNFAAKFTHHFGEVPGVSAEGGYDAVMAIAMASKRCQCLSPISLKHELLESDFIGASGHVRFNRHGQLLQEPALFQVQDGKLELLTTP